MSLAPAAATPPDRPPDRPMVIGFGAALFAILPLSTDIYLTAMPDLGRSLGASLAGVQATMAAFTLGFGIAHVAIGGLADRYGRRRVAVRSSPRRPPRWRPISSC
jgi:DHA1 family bicyclomycin/chloramphenicol resistance-like MFS transporter